MTTDVLDAGQVGTVAARALDVEVLTARPVAGSVVNQDFALTLTGGRHVLVKCGPGCDLAVEVWALGRAAAAGVPVPAVLHHEPSPGPLPLPFLVLGWVAGDEPPGPVALREAGSWLRAVHHIEVAGYGPLHVVGDATAPDSVSGRHASWDDHVAQLLDDLDRVVALGLLSRDQRSQVRARVAAVDPSGLARPVGRLLHGDIKTLHLRSARDRLTGIIDWGAAAVGDPAWDLARASMMGPASCAALLDGYGPDLGDLGEVLAVYRILWNVGALADEHAAGGDWFAEYQRRVAADLSV